jgi:hypothetical protein
VEAKGPIPVMTTLLSLDIGIIEIF